MITFVYDKRFELINVGQKTSERYTTVGRKREFSTVVSPPFMGLLYAASV
jgi:hypothetical protein